MTEFLVRMAQAHETYRLPELEALSKYINTEIEILDYKCSSPFCILKFKLPRDYTRSQVDSLARDFISRSILSYGIYELWGLGRTYDDLHASVKQKSCLKWPSYKNVSFKFSFDTFRGKRSTMEQRNLIESFSYLPLQGKIDMKHPDEEFVVFEEWDAVSPEIQTLMNSGPARAGIETPPRKPGQLFLGRKIGGGRRHLMEKHDLKKRPYISTTSMDAELALVTVTLALAGPGKLYLDPFVGTGGFMVAAAELGAVTLGSDIDGRSFRGKGNGVRKGVGANFHKYGLESRFGDCITSDLTNTPFRPDARWIDGIVCDPPYGIREGLKVLGRRLDGRSLPEEHGSAKRMADGSFEVNGVPSHILPDFVAPKRPYSFNRMLDDILEFAARSLVDGGRLAFWMPCANESEERFEIPQHPLLPLKHSCVQTFNKWSRRLLIYERRPGDLTEEELSSALRKLGVDRPGHSADDLNQFRRMYFRGFANGLEGHDV